MFDTATTSPPPRMTTPGKLVSSLIAIIVVAVLAAAGSLWAVGNIRDAARTVGRDAEPSVALALRMAAALADMDAVAIGDSLLDGGAAIGTSARFRAGTDQLASDIVDASRNITYGDAEALPLRELLRSLARYQEAIAEARSVGPGNIWLTSQRMQWASRVNRDFAAPQAEALAKANADELERHYADYRATALICGGTGFAAFALLVATLLGVQVFLARRMRRLVNPLLASATVIAAASGLWFGANVLTERADLRAAKADAYDSLHVLFEAKSAANALRAAMSLWLLDPAARADAQARIDAATHALIGTDLTRPDQRRPLLEGLGRALALERDGSPSRAIAEAPHPGGLLGTELDNVTFGVAEREAATQSVALLADAEALLRAVQTQELRPDHPAAVRLWLDEDGPGGAAVFLALQAALDRTIAVNQAQFDLRITVALGRAWLIPIVICAALVATALLSAGGLWLRLREYR